MGRQIDCCPVSAPVLLSTVRQPVPFGKYLLLDRISVGGMAEVFKAKSYGVEGFEKVIAIKRILPSMCEDEDFIRMFIDEAKIAGQLSHANICQIFELGRVKSSHFIAMEYISGRDLLQIQNRLRQRGDSMPVEMACFILAQVCEGLDYAHHKKDALGRPLKIIHRDCSPQNVLVSYEGEVKLIDFGIAKAASRSSRTNAGVLKGKFGYMSPEQVRGLPLDRRSDIFAVGTVLYESLTGQRLFLGESDFSTLERVRNADVTPPQDLNADIPDEVNAIVMKALARDPDDRYQWCGEMRADLHRYLTGRDRAFTGSGLSSWMREVFEAELENERKLMEHYKKVGRDGLIGGVPQAEAELDVVSALGEAGEPEGDPTVLGGPSLDDMLAEAEKRFSVGKKGRGGVHGFGDEGETDIAGEVDSDTEQPTRIRELVDPDSTVALDDASLLEMQPPENGSSRSGATGQTRKPINGPPVAVHSPTGVAALGPGPYRGPGEFGYTTDSVQPLTGYPLPSAAHLRRRPSLLRDIAIGVGIAVLVLGLFLAGKMLLAARQPDKTKATGALAVLAADGQAAKVLLNGSAVGETTNGKPLTLEGLAAGDYTVELRRDGATPCVTKVTVSESVEVVSCRLAPAVEHGLLRLDGVSPDHRIFINEIEISHQAALEPIQLPPGREQLIYVRVGETIVQEFRVNLAAGEELTRKVAPIAKVAVEDRPEPKNDDEPKERRNTDRPRHRDEPKAPTTPDEKVQVKPKKESVGYLTAKTRPWARVVIDDRDTGKMTPIPAGAKIPLKPGEHKVTFIVDGRNYSYRVKIEAGQTSHLEKTLSN